MRTPPSLGGPSPDLTLGYSSGSVDGRTLATNSQSSWVGEGWDLQPGFIERQYRTCSQDGNAPYGDLCWYSDNATMMFGGRSVRLVIDPSDDELADYLDGFAGRVDGAEPKSGGVGWYDAERGVTVIQRGEYSMTAFRESPEAFARRRAH